MPSPLTAKSPGDLSLGEQVVLVISLGVPAAGLWYCFAKHLPVHVNDPWLNLCAHAALVLFPLIWAWLFYHAPVVFESSDADVDLGHPSYFSTLPAVWWEMFIMWATPVFGVIALGQALNAKYLQHPQELSTSPGRAIFIMAVIFWLGVFYNTILLSRSEPTTRVSHEGLRPGILRFFKWEDIHHISRHDNLYAIHHRVNPALPVTAFRIRTHELQAILERYLAEHGVRISNDTEPAYLMVRIAVVLGFAANLAADFWLQGHTSLSLPSVVLISFGIGIVLTLLLEKYRGVSKYGKYKPILKLDEVAAPANQQQL